MPAPTALAQPAPAPELVPVATPEQDDELLVDMQGVNAEPSAVAPPTDAEDTDMAIDEEGRPRFAPGKDVVGSSSSRILDHKRRTTLTDGDT